MGIQNRSARTRPFGSRRGLAGLGLVVVALILAAVPANALAQDTETEPTPRVGGVNGFVDVVQVNGLIDPIMVSFINESLDQSLANGARGVVLQMESEGAAVDDDEITALASRIAEFEIPVSVWLGPANNGKALGRAGQLALASSRIGISPGSEFGDFGESVLEGAAANGPFVELFDGGFSGGITTFEDLFPNNDPDEGPPGFQNAPAILK